MDTIQFAERLYLIGIKDLEKGGRALKITKGRDVPSANTLNKLLKKSEHCLKKTDGTH